MFSEKIRKIYHKMRGIRACTVMINAYKRKFIKYYASSEGACGEKKLKREIIVDSHVLEKGFTHEDFRVGFGYEKVKNLYKTLQEYKSLEKKDQFVIDNAEGLLALYHKKNKDLGYDDTEYLPGIREVNEEDKKLDSIIILNSQQEILKGIRRDDFEEIAKARHSVRYYDKDAEELDNETIKRVLELAQTAPSACNRQATKVYVIKERKFFQKIEDLQLGCRGFGCNASAFFVITSKLALYEVAETKLPIFDAGMYTMNLLYALQSYGLYSCTLNASFPGETNQKIHELLGIPEEDDINGLVVVYKIPVNKKVRVPASPRRNANDISCIIERKYDE